MNDQAMKVSTRRGRSALAGLLAVSAAHAVFAGPPFLTDDPEPTDTGHWEIYAPAFDATGRTPDFDGSAGAEFNYGLAPDLQLTVGAPVGYTHASGGLTAGRDDLEASVKFRFFHDEARALQIAVFPGITVPTATSGFGARHVTALLPIWLQKDAGAWSWFGGGGYAINPGGGNRNYWTGGIALSRDLSQRVLVGIEADKQGAAETTGRAATSLGVGAILRFTSSVRLLASAGPTFVEGGTPTQFHVFVALGLDF
jgi:hypothetical protein